MSTDRIANSIAANSTSFHTHKSDMRRVVRVTGSLYLDNRITTNLVAQQLVNHPSFCFFLSFFLSYAILFFRPPPNMRHTYCHHQYRYRYHQPIATLMTTKRNDTDDNKYIFEGTFVSQLP
mmetsp:Transcript_44407/g.107427  ORF Transcript_44407/g.107427 Transcript_44407/m.107427 type:complete len:121 (-) Transcript_44407:41-403(-)